MNKRRILLLSIIICVCGLSAYLVFAGSGLLTPGAASIKAGEGYSFGLNLEPVKEAAKAGEEQSLPYTITVNISPAVESVNISPSVNAQLFDSKLIFKSADLDAVNSLKITVYPGKNIMEETSYTVSASVSGVDVAGDSCSFTVTPENPQQKGGKAGIKGSSGGSGSVDSSLVYAGSWDNYLESLSVEGYEFTNEFNKTRDTYFVSVPENVESLDVSATASDSSAKVRIAGADNVSEELSKILINVTADNGVTRIYRIYVKHTTEEL